MPDPRSSAAYPIAIAYAAIFAWAVLLLGAGVYFATDAAFHRQQDREIAGELERLSRETDRARLLRELRGQPERPPAFRYDYALFAKDGQRIEGTLDTKRPPTGLSELQAPGGRNTSPAIRGGAIDLADGARLVIARDSSGQADGFGPLKDRIRRLFLLSVVGVVLACSLGGIVLARYLRRRLSPINATANAIITGHMDWRVPVGKRGDEFDTAGQTVNLMLDRISGLMDNLRQVSSDIAHDMRKPLMRLLVQTDRLGNVDGAERVQELGDELLLLFSSILRIAEVEGGGIERNFRPVDLSSLMIEVAESFAPAVSDGGDSIEWAIEPDIAIMGNRELLAQVVANLIDNARTHTPPGTNIRLRLSSEGSDAIVSVEDDGPGVPHEIRDKLFQRFFRAEASRSMPGNGLGLSLVAAVVRAHGGSVVAEDASSGLRMVIRLHKAEDFQSETETE